MFAFLKHWRERRIIEAAAVSQAQWDTVFAWLPLLDGLAADERRRLRELAILFCHRKTFVGAHDLVVTDEMRLVIALQACLPILELGLDTYRGWTSIVVYPSGFVPEHTFVDDYGVEHEARDERSGEAWQHGPVLLAWDEAIGGGEVDGYNLVIHEFAHKLDMLNGSANGFPPLHADMSADTWSRIFSAGYEDFGRHCDDGIDLGSTATRPNRRPSFSRS